MKLCLHCKEKKPILEFQKEPLFDKIGAKDGLRVWCDDCYEKIKKKFHLRSNKYSTRYVKERKRVDPLFKFTSNIRGRTYAAFKAKYWKKDSPTERLLGCTYNEAFKHISSQFTEGMTWDNYGDWHVDHIIPLSSAGTKERLKELAKYTNLQPLWAADNLKKGARTPIEL